MNGLSHAPRSVRVVYNLSRARDMIEVDLFAFLGIVVATHISPRFALSERYETEMSDQEILRRIHPAIPACREETSIAVWNLLGALVLVLGKIPLAIPKSRDGSWRGS